MLKLEKVAKTCELNAILREKPTLFSYSFLVALSYALICHLAALLLFQVSPFKISYEASILAPVQVASDFPFPDAMQQISLQYDDQGPVPDHLLAPMFIPAQLPDIASIAYPQELQILPLPVHSVNPFISMENEIGIWQGPTFFSENVSDEPLVVRTSGGIAETEVTVKHEIFDDLLKQFALKNPSLHRIEPYNFVFAVQVDQRRGEVFWWEQQQEAAAAAAELNGLAIRILESLSFAPETPRLIDRGVIEIAITL